MKPPIIKNNKPLFLPNKLPNGYDNWLDYYKYNPNPEILNNPNNIVDKKKDNRTQIQKNLYNGVVPNDYNLSNTIGGIVGGSRSVDFDDASEEAFRIYTNTPSINSNKYFNKDKKTNKYSYNNKSFNNDIKNFIINSEDDQKYSKQGIEVHEYDVYNKDGNLILNNPARALGRFSAGLDTINNNVWVKDKIDLDPVKNFLGINPNDRQGTSSIENISNSALNYIGTKADNYINSKFNPFDVENIIPLKNKKLVIPKHKLGGEIKVDPTKQMISNNGSIITIPDNVPNKEGLIKQFVNTNKLNRRKGVYGEPNTIQTNKFGQQYKVAPNGIDTMFINKYKDGGFVDGLRNIGATIGDTTLSAVGAGNVADNNDWYTKDKQGAKFAKAGNIAGKAAQAAVGTVLSVVGTPALGAAYGAAMTVAAQADKNKGHYDQYLNGNNSDEIGNAVSQGVGAIGSIAASQPTMVAEDGGVVPNGDIPEGKTLINVERNELEVDPNSLKIIKHFKNKPNHPAYGIDEQGNTLAAVGNVIIPQNMNKKYKQSDTFQKKAMINNLKYKQTMREGGKYEYGGMIKKYDGTNGSVVTGPRADGGYYNFNNPIAPINNILLSPKVGMPDVNTTPSVQTSTRLANRLSNPISKWNTNTINKPLNYSYDVAGRQELDRDGNPVSVNPMASNNYQAPGSESRKPMEIGNYGNTAAKVGMYAPAAYNLARGLFDKAYNMDSSKYMTKDIQAPELTGDAGRRDMLTAYNTGKYNINQLRTSGVMSGLINNNNKYSQNLATYNENLENKNKLLTFEASRSNQENQRSNNQLKMGIDQFNEQNKAAKRNFTSTALTQGSNIIQNERNNKMIAESIKGSGRYGYWKDGQYIIKGSKEDKE